MIKCRWLKYEKENDVESYVCYRGNKFRFNLKVWSGNTIYLNDFRPCRKCKHRKQLTLWDVMGHDPQNKIL